MESDAYDAGQFDRVLDGVWIPAHVEDAIAAIVDDADAAFGFGTLWPANWWDEYHDGQPAKVLYAGAAGVIWALDALRRSGHAETSLDLGAAALRTLELERTEPDASEDEHYRPGSLLHGETGPLLVACRLAPDTTLADDLHALVRSNVANPTDDISWGRPERCWQRSQCTSGRGRHGGWRWHASRGWLSARVVVTTGCGGRMTTTAAWARCTAPPETPSRCCGLNLMRPCSRDSSRAGPACGA
jgi:hypothetical protein